MRTIVLIACSKQKQAKPAPARDLYSSPLFRKSLAHAESLGADAIYVLSAKHGLLSADQIVAPYDETLSAMSRHDTRAWSQRVLAQLTAVCDVKQDRIIFLAGKTYRQDLLVHMTNFEVPMKGLGIGQQLQFLTRKARVTP